MAFRRMAFARARKPRVPGAMNKTEAEYSLVLLAAKSRGEIEHFEFEAVTFKLGPDCRYTPDFMVIGADGTIEFHEVKGSQKVDRGKPNERVKARIEDDARVKYIVAAERFWPFRFALAYKVPEGWAIDYAE